MKNYFLNLCNITENLKKEIRNEYNDEYSFESLMNTVDEILNAGQYGMVTLLPCNDDIECLCKLIKRYLPCSKKFIRTIKFNYKKTVSVLH